jgi:hypothetical protein
MRAASTHLQMATVALRLKLAACRTLGINRQQAIVMTPSHAWLLKIGAESKTQAQQLHHIIQRHDSWCADSWVHMLQSNSHYVSLHVLLLGCSTSFTV